MKTSKVVLVTVAGLALGTIAGVLFAPAKGSSTRRQIRDKSDDYVDKLKSKFDSTKKDVEGFVDKGKAKYDYAKKHVKNTAANFSHDVAEDINHATS